jgi:hypothetical protein
MTTRIYENLPTADDIREQFGETFDDQRDRMRAETAPGVGALKPLLQADREGQPLMRSPTLVRLGHAALLYLAFCVAFVVARVVTP